MTGNSNGVSTYTTAINNNFAAIKAELANVGGGLSYSTFCPALNTTNGQIAWSLTHNLNTTNIKAVLYNSSNQEILKNVTVNSANAITVTFKSSTNVAASSHRIVVYGV